MVGEYYQAEAGGTSLGDAHGLESVIPDLLDLELIRFGYVRIKLFSWVRLSHIELAAVRLGCIG